MAQELPSELYLVANPQRKRTNDTLDVFDLENRVSLKATIGDDERSQTVGSLDGSPSLEVSNIEAQSANDSPGPKESQLPVVSKTSKARETMNRCGSTRGTFDLNNVMCASGAELSVWSADGIERKVRIDGLEKGASLLPKASSRDLLALSSSGEGDSIWLYRMETQSLRELKAFGPEDLERSQAEMVFFSKSSALVGAVYQNGLIALWNTSDGQLAGKIKLTQLSFASGFFDNRSETLLVTGLQETDSDLAFTLQLPESLESLIEIAADARFMKTDQVSKRIPSDSSGLPKGRTNN